MLNEQLEEHQCSKMMRRKEQLDESETPTDGPKEAGRAKLWTWITSSHDSKTQEFHIGPQDWAMISAFTAVTLGVRLWRISWPDEAA